MTEKITLLVDELGSHKVSGLAIDSKKVKYNLRQIPDLDEMITTMVGKSTKGGMTLLFPVGRYIAIYQGKSDRSVERLFFFDHRVEIMHAHLSYVDLITEDTVGKFRLLSGEVVST
ncbi:MAG: hypothetical protein ACKO96_15005 [Flammeovirgaceae bacterium]